METDTIMILLWYYYKFKSYYVVWKLFGFFATKRASAVFKSYYVVWKLDTISDEEIEALCLNRTM